MDAQKPFILVVEDDDYLRSVIARNLQARGYMVLQAATFRQALDCIAIKPALVILDINLPDASGWEVAQWLEEQDVPVPIVVMSGHSAPSLQQWRHFHPAAFLPKPFEIDQLLHLVEEHTQHAQAR
jgi:two-component system, OmpR family, KDP operon response regulator KdpE